MTAAVHGDLESGSDPEGEASRDEATDGRAVGAGCDSRDQREILLFYGKRAWTTVAS